MQFAFLFPNHDHHFIPINMFTIYFDSLQIFSFGLEYEKNKLEKSGLSPRTSVVAIETSLIPIVRHVIKPI